MPWDPERYQQFYDERMAPFEDLLALARFPDALPQRRELCLVDLGCGTGELTARLCDRLGAQAEHARVLGIDNSRSMLARAQELSRPQLQFAHADIADFAPAGPVDVLFSHAALQWVDDHGTLFKRLCGFLSPGGQLLVQMPANHNHVSHRIVRELAKESPWQQHLGGFCRYSPVQGIDFYAELLHAVGCREPLVIEKVYGHILKDARAVLDWVRGTMLIPYLERLDRLDPSLSAAFLAEVERRYCVAMPAQPYYFAFKRTLIVATAAPACVPA